MSGDYGSGMVIGMKGNERKYGTIIKKLLRNEVLDADDMDFLKKKGLL